MTSAEKYVLGAYLVVLAVVLAYVVIFGAKLARLERDVAELAERAKSRRAPRGEAQEREAARVG